MESYSEYTIPDGLTDAQVRSGIIELMRPCSPTVTAYFVRLHACKPFFDGSQEKIGIVFDCLYDDIKDFSEIAVIMGLEDSRKSSGKWFPSNGEIIQEIRGYDELIRDVSDYFN